MSSSVAAKTASASAQSGVKQNKQVTGGGGGGGGGGSDPTGSNSKTPLRPRLVQQTRSISSNPLLDENRSQANKVIPKSTSRIKSSHALLASHNNAAAAGFASKGM